MPKFKVGDTIVYGGQGSTGSGKIISIQNDQYTIKWIYPRDEYRNEIVTRAFSYFDNGNYILVESELEHFVKNKLKSIGINITLT